MTKKEMTLARLKQGPVNGPDLAVNDWRYTDSIHKLRSEGYDITSMSIMGKSYCRYELVSEPGVSDAGTIARAKRKREKVWTQPTGRLGVQMLVQKGEFKNG
jgi:hypothetical protein